MGAESYLKNAPVGGRTKINMRQLF